VWYLPLKSGGDGDPCHPNAGALSRQNEFAFGVAGCRRRWNDWLGTDA